MSANEELQRLRWRCRRGMLEIDLILDRFLDVHGKNLTDEQIEALYRLLEYPDPVLFDIILKRAPVEDSLLAHLITMM